MAPLRHQSTYAITLLTSQRRRLFQRTSHADLFLTTLFHYRAQGRFLLHAFVVMPDHVHVLITPAIDLTIARCVQLLKGGFSFALREQFAGDVWHSGHYEHRIRNEADFLAQKLYIANNPARKHIQNLDHIHTHAAFAHQLDNSLPPISSNL